MRKGKNIKFNKLMLLTIVILMLFGSFNAFAGNTNDFINQVKLNRDKITKEILKSNNAFLDFRKISAKKVTDYQTTIEDIKNKHQGKLKTGRKIRKTEKAIVFVSFSMPELSLKQIIHDAARYRVPVVIRGLYQNSFRKTVEKMFKFVKENKKGGIAINPRWFKEYGIKMVPAVVVAKEHGPEDVVYGNIPLKKALLLIVDRGELSNVAQSILDRDDK
jgi:type-F conjugative transfer system pilin assembly protein TrbC